MGFWDSINQALDKTFGVESASDSSAFPSDSSLGASDPYASALASAEAISPDQALPPTSGPAPAQANDPFANNTEQMIQIQSGNSTPFTVIDINPYLSIGTRGYSTGGPQGLVGPPTPNQSYAASANTLKQISNMLNIAALTANTANLINEGVFPIGATFPYAVSGNTLKIEQLPIGSVNTPTSILTALIGNDVRGQQVLNLFLNGIFIQFESPDAPVFIAKPGETYRLPFTKVFVTTFGAGNRWRLIAGSGNSTAIEGFSDLRTLRQQLHMWDGSGLFDNPMVHPVPFSSGFSLPSSLNGSVQVVQSSLDTGAPNGIFSNYDPGTGLSQRPNGQVVGSVVNNGYKIFWATNLTIQLVDISGSANQLNFVQIYKGIGALGTNAPAVNGAILYKNNFTVIPANGSITLSASYNVPKRVILAGFQTFDPSQEVNFYTGESVFAQLGSTGNQRFNATVTYDGYYWPGLVPYCPYPMDTQLLPTN